MIKYSNEAEEAEESEGAGVTDAAASEPAPKPISTNDTTSTNNTPKVDPADRARDLKSGLIMIKSAIRRAEREGFLGGRKLISRIKSKRDIINKYNSDYNRDAKGEFGTIINEIQTVITRNFKLFKEVIEAENKEELESLKENVNKAELVEYSDKLNASNEMGSQFFKWSPSYIILNKIIPIIHYLFKDIENKYIEVEIEESEFNLKNLYRAINALQDFVKAFEGYAVDVRVQKIRSSRIPDGEAGDSKKSPTDKGDAPTKRGLPSEDFKGLNIEGLISLEGVNSHQGRIGQTVFQPILKVDNPLKSDLFFGIKFNESSLPYDPRALMQYVIKKGSVEVADSFDFNSDFSFDIYKFEESDLLRVKIRKSAIETARKLNEEVIFSISDKMRDRKEVLAEDIELPDMLKKQSSVGTTTPLYKTVSPSGASVSFTPADLVIGGGYLKDPKGKRFKPTKIKGKSLASRVMSKDFGKVKK